MLADWTFGTVLWSALVFFFWFTVIWMFISVFADIFRRRDLSGGAKAGWIVLVVVLPFLGVLIYLIARPQLSDQERQEFYGFGRHGGASRSAASEIATAADLKDRGVISDAEFEEIKRKALASG
jgi:uncharacterized membrane protein